MNEHNEETAPPSRWAFIRDVAVFQGKLVIDGLRDLVLVPLSLAAAIIGMLAEPKDPGKKFYGWLHSAVAASAGSICSELPDRHIRRNLRGEDDRSRR